MQRFKRERALSSAGSERLPYKQRVGGSNPSAPTKETYLAFRFRPITEETLESSINHFKGRLAQLVQSVCLTSRGSGVRIPQRPLKNKTKSTLSLILFIYLQATPLPPGQRSLGQRIFPVGTRGCQEYSVASLNMKNLMSPTPRNCVLNALILALKDSADAFVSRRSK